jgi:hypothetical protein
VKALLSVVGGMVLGAGVLSTPALAQNYPWCAYESTGDGYATNCGFVTREQCMATISGLGGSCEPNNQYVPPKGAHSDRAATTSNPDQR